MTAPESNAELRKELAAANKRADAAEKAALEALESATAPTPKPRPAPTEFTGEGTHVATQRGYCGTIIDPGEGIPAGIAVSDSWMAKAGEPAADA